MATKTQLVRKVYTYADGTEGRSAKPGWTSLRFEFLAPEKDDDDKAVVLETVAVSSEDFSDEILDCAKGHGLSQKLGDDLAGIAGKATKDGVSPDEERGYVDYAVSRLQDAIDNLKAGVWVAEGEGSSGAGNVTILFEAIVAAFADAGKDLDEAQMAKVREKLKDEDYRKAAKSREDVAAHVARINAERAAERAAKAKAKAASADTDTLGDLLDAEA